MLNTYMVLKPYWKNMGTPGQDIHHYSMDKSIYATHKVENNDFIMMTNYITYI